MSLKVFIQQNKKEITEEWIKYAEDNLHPTDEMDLEEIRDHIGEMLDRITNDMDSPQTDAEQESKSKGNKDLVDGESSAAIAHGEQRVASGFDIVELSSEFRALRASVLRLWDKKIRDENWKEDFHEMIRFNEAIDELWMISVKRFQEKLDESKRWIFGILGHDLRTPITSISAANSVLKLSQNLSEEDKSILKQSDASIKRMTELINNLLELTEIRLGSSMNISREEINLLEPAKRIIKEIRLAYPESEIKLEAEDNIIGHWDNTRIEQMLTNLMTNAIKHGKPGGEIQLKIYAKDDSVCINIHNDGDPIPKALRDKIFENKFSQNNSRLDSNQRSYGLGLFIVKEIVEGHQGEIELKTSKKEGTSFIISLPRN